eukprot:CAMPEP_0194519408 /NCGR_PEP_ID=MMETSP0253-20130528/53059_1 /TAXON_ID=2966 /ORGANISM="Noctiluca scintillans" /LENGTH=51 /DNA_ID=CAMNT_0039363543 /DNA_START=1066 /DNA_END=1218 /DNA_ORIENTATION=+
MSRLRVSCSASSLTVNFSNCCMSHGITSAIPATPRSEQPSTFDHASASMPP